MPAKLGTKDAKTGEPTMEISVKYLGVKIPDFSFKNEQWKQANI